MYTYYNKTTGKLIRNSSEYSLRDNEECIEGQYNLNLKKFNLKTKKIENIFTDKELLEKETAINWDQFKTKRNILLLESDYRVLPDSTTTKLEEWKTYRQALRDLPANTSDPLNVTWPTPPE